MRLFDFLLKSQTSRPEENTDPEPQIRTITGTGRNYGALDTYDTALKFWLPEVMKTAFIEMCNHANTTRSEIIRQTLFTYLYGRYDLFGLIERGDSRFALTSPALYSRAVSAENRSPELGKNTEDVKVWIAKQMKDDLQALADKSSLTLSHFIREILISNLFGHTYLPERFAVDLLQLTIDDKPLP